MRQTTMSIQVMATKLGISENLTRYHLARLGATPLSYNKHGRGEYAPSTLDLLRERLGERSHLIRDRMRQATA